jgi:hypothetical protein
MKILLILIVTIEHFILYKVAFKLGVVREQQARLRRLNTLKRLVNHRAKL